MLLTTKHFRIYKDLNRRLALFSLLFPLCDCVISLFLAVVPSSSCPDTEPNHEYQTRRRHQFPYYQCGWFCFVFFFFSLFLSSERLNKNSQRNVSIIRTNHPCLPALSLPLFIRQTLGQSGQYVHHTSSPVVRRLLARTDCSIFRNFASQLLNAAITKN